MISKKGNGYERECEVVFGLIGGLTLFLYGMNSMSDALQKAAGERMKKILGFLTLLGDNIGTTITALLASIGQSKNAKRTAIAHSIFNISGSIVFIFLIPWFSRFVQFISPAGNEIDVISRQIANAHTTFNVVCTLVWLPLIPLMVKIVTTIISGNNKVRRVSYAPQFAGINANEQQVAEQGTVAVVSFESEKTRKAAKGSAAAI